MPTAKKVFRELSAASKRVDRKRKRQAREEALFLKQQQQIELQESAQKVVNTYNRCLEYLQSFHLSCSDGVDWNAIHEEKVPLEPTKTVYNEAEVQEKINNFRPSFFDKIFGRTTKKIKQLELRKEEAKIKDQEEFELAMKDYLIHLDDWNTLQKICKGVKKGELKAYRDAIQYFNPLADLSDLGSRINITFLDDFIDVDLVVKSDEVIPKIDYKLTSMGKLSKKNLSKTRFNEIYQDHVCSCLIRVSNEVLAYLPVKELRVNALANMLNSSTGHLEIQPIVSVLVVRETIDSLNMNKIDPSDSLVNFNHNMKFSKTKGFTPIKKVTI